MTPEHYITFVCLQTKNGYQFVQLTPEDAPVADFAVAGGDEPVKVYPGTATSTVRGQPSSRDPRLSKPHRAPVHCAGRALARCFVKLRFDSPAARTRGGGSRYHAT